MASLHYDLRQAGLVPAAEENQTIAQQAALASGSATYGRVAFSELQQESASDEAAIQAQSYGSVTGLWNQEMSAFKGNVLDELAYEGNQDLENGNTFGFVGTGLKSSFFETFMPGSVGQTALMLGGGEVVGPAVGELSRFASDAVPLLGRDVTDLAGAAWNRLSNINPFAGSAARIGSTPLSAQLGHLNLSLFESASGPELGDGTAVGSGGGTTTVYRVEGAPNQRIVIDASGNVSLAPGNDNMLFLNFGQEGRAAQYYAQKVAGGLPDVQIKSFEVDNSFFEQIQNDAVPQEFGRQFPDSPQLVDTTKAPNQYGIPAKYFDQLTNSIVPGSGQNNVNPLDLFPPPPFSP